MLYFILAKIPVSFWVIISYSELELKPNDFPLMFTLVSPDHCSSLLLGS
ncbi:hypothetical protein MICAK_3930009 [Microcystis aeruginosa PCC 9701]|uniref:Uncharacterized protein n=1 Tax=Microcystis aeruginosa PCC 9701 TaxID=721123 RepID=I4IV84_MICAE|nr:hypothetical protein MICAK_3930009 [Microcystis aeruginosa PCC 9701]